ncbi:MAG: hypothetical protein CVV05_01475 [Gammaproteobacteria bacterium HGW-Gammaproteobacteria-1]|nr:MAG: hypothetical protein CVV05_01475 [Gammaproteobacteria bacterium HGW-Gammaproteobacteria-1]
MLKSGAVLAALLALCGCDSGEITKEYLSSAKQPDIYLGAGVILQISEAETATVYGRDKCPGHEMPEWLFGTAVESEGCTQLSGRNSVPVILITDHGRLEEMWTVTEDDGPYGARITIKRPDGWVLREPKS